MDAVTSTLLPLPCPSPCPSPAVYLMVATLVLLPLCVFLALAPAEWMLQVCPPIQPIWVLQ